MTGTDQLKRTIEACRRAGLPVIDDTQCTCKLHGRLVVLASLDGLRFLWPYDGRCPVHDPPDSEGPRACLPGAAGQIPVAGRGGDVCGARGGTP
jgi:hypothetical protein